MNSAGLSLAARSDIASPSPARLPSDQYLAFLDAAPDAMVILDAEGQIVLANVETEAMFQCSRGELVGRSIEVLLPAHCRARHRGHFTAQTDLPRRRPLGAGLELYGLRKDGSEFPIEIILRSVVTEAGRYVTGVIRDVTGLRHATRSLIEARHFAEKASHAKSQFLAAAGHDLRQPLQTLTLLNNVLARAVPTRSSAAAVVANQAEALRFMAELVDALLDISKLEAGVISPNITDFPVRRMFGRLQAEFAPLAERKGLDLLVDGGRAMVQSDPTLLCEIVQNLIANAIRYTERGSVSLRCRVGSDSVIVEVADTGVGIPAAELERIFDDFYQAARPAQGVREGAGLGLAIAHRMAQLLGCSLQVRSTVGEGSCFSLTVPRSNAHARNDTGAGPKTETCGQLEGTSVLIIDDDPAVAHATALLLSSLRADSVVASGAEAALKSLREGAEPPAILICDFHLGPSETGADAIRAIRRALGVQVPAIVVSGDTSRRVSDELLGLKCCHLLSKPVDTDELLNLCVNLQGQDA
jgi:PAS domain S-box-containing protein